VADAEPKKFLQDYEMALEEMLRELSELPANEFAESTKIRQSEERHLGFQGVTRIQRSMSPHNGGKGPS
jgi:hypothetical protein